MSTKAWNASRLSGPDPSTPWSLKKPLQHGSRPPKGKRLTVCPPTRPKQTIRISASHASQQLDQAKAACLAVTIRDLEEATAVMRSWEHSLVTPQCIAPRYSIIMFMITAVKRLRESKMLTLSWFNQALMMVSKSGEEMRNLRTAMWILANLIPREVLPLTGDLLPSLQQQEPPMLKQ
ncbi:C protein [Rinderpest virus (strain Kabete O)]|uniref:Protein C n=3 Tax=Rinderpest morbillivirus TaxID=11241 RepID=C_RINDK|nr:C protein [Rinderpest virus (strain Kabete O)]P35948.1 RecName: Full=Protein C [Rinderpest virus (strain Kabete O)]AAB23269.1 C protein [Rinderpest morbillivirus]QJD08636.1 non-structural C protein [Rinderpest morbillivirus]QJD08643.1 non-structural C protein [Rinderpest morbillivirus]QJD08727.1 non-structural C protein [Rinderpest morbillivirus]QJD08811.1 non-structural C protein [Rinderpest morbillivirus]